MTDVGKSRFDAGPLDHGLVGDTTRSGARAGLVAQFLTQLGSLAATMIMARMLSKRTSDLWRASNPL